MRLVLSLPTHPSHIITQTPIPTGQNTHCSHLVLHLHPDQGVDVRPAGEHLHRRAGALDFLGVTRARDEQHNPEDFTTAVHAQDAGHPGTDPFEVFGRLDDPDQGYSAGGHGAFGIALDKLADEGDLVRDSDTTSDEKNGAVGVHGVDASVRALSERAEGNAGVHGILGAHEQLVGETGSTTDKQGEGRFLRAQGVLTGHGNALLIGDDLLGFAPSDREWV